MQIVLNIVFLVAGFALLIKGADVFVDASANIARRLRVPSVVIGLTVVAFGTSAPEAVVSISAALRGANSLAIGNAVGSNLFNLLIVIGLCSVIRPIAVNFKEITRDYWVSVGAAFVLLAYIFIFGDIIPRLASAAVFAVFVLYMVLLVRQALRDRPPEEAAEAKEGAEPLKPMWHSICFAVLGAVGIVAGGQLAVIGAIEIATFLGMTERVIGLTIVAVGTSLPELVTSAIAAKKKENDIAVGNVIGSNIFNLMFVLGLSGTLMPLSIDPRLVYDLAVLIIVSVLFLLFTRTKGRVSRPEGAIFVAIYAAYMLYTLLI